MSDKAAKKAKRKTELEKKRRRYLEMGYLLGGISEDEMDSEEDEAGDQHQQRTENGRRVDLKTVKAANNVAESATVISVRGDPTWGKVVICIASSPKVGAGDQDWLSCDAKFDSGTDDDWISEKLVTKIGFPQEEAQPLECKNFDGTIFLSDQHVSRLTWMREEANKSISGSFRILPDAPFDLLIGRITLFRAKIFIPASSPRAAGVLVTRKITKEEAAANKAKALKHKSDSEAHLAKRVPAAVKLPVRNNSKGQGMQSGSNKAGGASI